MSDQIKINYNDVRFILDSHGNLAIIQETQND